MCCRAYVPVEPAKLHDLNFFWKTPTDDACGKWQWNDPDIKTVLSQNELFGTLHIIDEWYSTVKKYICD